MPYYTFHDREQNRPEIAGNWKAQLIQFFRSREKEPRKTDSLGMALQSAAGQFMARNRMPEKFRPLVIDAIKKYFRPQEHISDPSKPMIGTRAPLGQMKLTFESVFRSHLIIEGGDSVTLPNGKIIDLYDGGIPFITDSTPESDVVQGSYNIAHWDVSTKMLKMPSSPLTAKVLQARDNGMWDDFDVWPDIVDESGIILGRYWPKYKVMAFWNRPKTVRSVLLKIFKQLKLDPNAYLIDFSPNEKSKWMSVRDVLSGMDHPLSPYEKEQLRIQRELHTNPPLKKQVINFRGSGQQNNVSQKAGYRSTAQYNADRIVGDSVEHE